MEFLSKSLNNFKFKEIKQIFGSQVSPFFQFPDFAKHVPNYIDLRTIAFKLQIGEYHNVYEVIHDLRQIVYSANIYLKVSPRLQFPFQIHTHLSTFLPQNHSNALMSKSLNSFEYELESMLSEKFFTGMNFAHITGGPNDKVYQRKFVCLEFVEKKYKNSVFFLP